MGHAAIKATYSDLKVIKGRKVCQVICEIPLEQSTAFVEAFGMPNPAAETWVAIARLTDGAERGQAKQEKIIKRWGDFPLSQQAAMRCGEPAFWRFLDEEGHSQPAPVSAHEAADAVRELCGVSSRSDIGKTEESVRKWKALDAAYQFWLRSAA